LVSDVAVTFDTRENKGGTPLHSTCFRGRKDILELLIAKGANMNVKNNTGQTALSMAKELKYEEIVELLRQNGARDKKPTIALFSSQTATTAIQPYNLLSNNFIKMLIF
jgi:ankyrin repeat protein